jgi:PAS domain S-box-containing protein
MLNDSVRMVLDLLMNLTFLISLTILSDFMENRFPRSTTLGSILQGLLFGTAAVIGMLRPLVIGQGLIFDGRSIMVSLCAWYFGPMAVAIAGIMPLVLRISIGGSGMVMGVLVIVSSAGIGLVARQRQRPDDTPPGTASLYLFGLAVHACMIVCMFTLPSGVGLSTFRRVGPLIITMYPLATILAGKILSDQIKSRMAVAALRESEERFNLSMEATSDGLWDLDVASDIAYYNKTYYRILGYEPGEYTGTGEAWRSRLHPDDLERTLEANRHCIDGASDFIDSEYRLKAKDGTWRWIRARGKCVARDEQGKALRLVGTHVDITERKEAQDRLRNSLEEKEILLREVNHRVKNNLNVISSLLSLQAGLIQTPEQAIAAFGNSRDRVMAMALVHEELYKSMDYSRVDMGEYLDKLVNQLDVVHGESGRIRILHDAAGVILNVSTSIPCGLILNELITNSFKYAFPRDRHGDIRVAMKHVDNHEVELSVADDGVGLPEGYDGTESGSLGMTLVHLLVKQLNGSLEATSSGGSPSGGSPSGGSPSRGAKFKIVFPYERNPAVA